jgi:hypothetical protein
MFDENPIVRIFHLKKQKQVSEFTLCAVLVGAGEKPRGEGIYDRSRRTRSVIILPRIKHFQIHSQF